MEIIFLGTGTIYPDPERRAPSLVLKHGREVLVFDSGPGTWYRLSEAGLDFRKVSALLYSHLHPDHVLDFPAYLFLTHIPDYPRSGDLHVFAPRGFEKFHKAIKDVFGKWMEPPGIKVKIRLLPRRRKTFTFKSFTVTSAPVKHHQTSTAFRVEAGRKSFVYGGDLEYCPEIVRLAKGADLLVTESAHPENNPREGHLTPSQAGGIAAEAGVKKLALTHFYPDCKKRDMAGPAKKVFGGEVIVARDLMRLKV
jgi:ribonuclease BN (tRNA processing enzyme)